MRRTGTDWGRDEATSLWTSMTPQEGAGLLVQIFGSKATAKAKWLARYTRDLGDDSDYRFWTAVYARLYATGRRQAGGDQQ